MGDDKTYLYGKAVGGKGSYCPPRDRCMEEGVGKIARKEKARVDSLKLKKRRLF